MKKRCIKNVSDRIEMVIFVGLGLLGGVAIVLQHIDYVLKTMGI